MEIKRIIRFQIDPINEQKTEVSKESEENNDIQKELSNIQEEYKKNEYDKLRECIGNVESGIIPTNMIGVFGKRSDIIIQNTFCNVYCRISHWQPNYSFVGMINHATDIYNEMTLYFCRYIERKFGYGCYLETVKMFKDVYKISRDGKDDSERSKDLLQAIKQLYNDVYYRFNYSPRFVIIVEMSCLNIINTLECLSKLNSSELIIIVYSKLDFNSERNTFRDFLGTKSECINKYFSRENCIEVHNYEIWKG